MLARKSISRRDKLKTRVVVKYIKKPSKLSEHTDVYIAMSLETSVCVKALSEKFVIEKITKEVSDSNLTEASYYYRFLYVFSLITLGKLGLKAHKIEYTKRD